jgi:outer membrane protein, multidrug efflux system
MAPKSVIFTIIICLAGCMVGPDYHRPAVEVPQSFRYEVTDARETANTRWWTQFSDPVLDRLISEALANNQSVKVAAARVDQAAGLLMTTRAALFPQVTYGGATSRERVSPNDVFPTPTPNPFNNFQVFAGASWEIDLWGRVRRLSEAAKATILATDEARRGVILSLVAEVAATYIQLRAFDEQLLIAQRSLKTYEDGVNLFELQYKYGQVNQMTVEQARSQYENAAVAIPQITNQIALTENGLSILLGRNPGPIARGRSLRELSMPPIPTGLPSQLLARRPDILQAEQNLIAANAQIGAAKALYFPTISLTGFVGQSSSELSDLFSGPSRIWNYTGSFLGPIFQGGAIKGQVKQAQANQEALLWTYRQTIQNAFADVENSLVSRRELEKQSGAEMRRVTAYGEYTRLARLQYDGGYVPYLTVLYAEAQLFPSELSAVQTRAATFISLVNVYKAMGGGWVTEADREIAATAPGGPGK